MRSGSAQQGEVVMTGRLDAAQCDKALQFLDGVAAPHVIELRGLEYVSSAGLGRAAEDPEASHGGAARDCGSST